MDAASARYSTLQIALHWLIAAAVLFQLVFGESMTNVVDAAEEGRRSPAPTSFWPPPITGSACRFLRWSWSALSCG